ncbi:erythroblast NAD(P)(+)--arginine ADP-ribosyltransferase-like [Passerculus sandwichensis]
MATTAVEVVNLDMALNSFDDQYQCCGPAMEAALPALNNSEFEQNKKFAEVWGKAAAKVQSQGPPKSPLSTGQATAIMAFTMDDLSSVFNDAVHVAGRSSQEYRDNFHFKTLHFLLTNATVTLKNNRERKCYDVSQEVCETQFKAREQEIVRFGNFTTMESSPLPGKCPEEGTVFQVHTCQGVDIKVYAANSETDGVLVLIPPFETFEVTKYTETGRKTEIKLQSAGPFSKYQCEWQKDHATGGSVPRATFHVGGLLLATTALAVATGII